MIENPSALAALQSEWEGVVRMRERVRNLVFSTFAFDSTQSPSFGDVLYNLPLVLAFEVLTKALILAKDEGLFMSSSVQLDGLMDDAKTALPWLDWRSLRDGVTRRNEVAQSGKLYGDLQCLMSIARIEDQLTAWGVISPAQPIVPAQTISFSQGFQKRL
jgi:hypothetical protein